MAKEAKIVCKNIFKNSNKTMITTELTEKIAKLVCRSEGFSFNKKA